MAPIYSYFLQYRMRPSLAACTYYGHTYWQYRMHPALAAYPSAAFYGGRLTSGVSEEARPPPRGIAWPHADADGRGATPLAFLGVGDEAAQLPDLEAQVRWLSPLDHPYASRCRYHPFAPPSPLATSYRPPPHPIAAGRRLGQLRRLYLPWLYLPWLYLLRLYLLWLYLLRQVGTSKANRTEARALAVVAARLLPHLPPGGLAVITPFALQFERLPHNPDYLMSPGHLTTCYYLIRYAAQIDALRTELRRARVAPLPTVATVDSFQATACACALRA